MSWTPMDASRQAMIQNGRILRGQQTLIRMVRDTDRDTRLKHTVCRYCWYLRAGEVSGQAFTPYTCEQCGVENQWHTTAVPKLCEQCAHQYEWCLRCGADLADESPLTSLDEVAVPGMESPEEHTR